MLLPVFIYSFSIVKNEKKLTVFLFKKGKGTGIFFNLSCSVPCKYIHFMHDQPQSYQLRSFRRRRNQALTRIKITLIHMVGDKELMSFNGPSSL